MIVWEAIPVYKEVDGRLNGSARLSPPRGGAYYSVFCVFFLLQKKMIFNSAFEQYIKTLPVSKFSKVFADITVLLLGNNILWLWFLFGFGASFNFNYDFKYNFILCLNALYLVVSVLIMQLAIQEKSLIKFKKAKGKGLREARIEAVGTSADSMHTLLDRYDVEIELIGTPKLIPGNSIYIDPKGFSPMLGDPWQGPSSDSEYWKKSGNQFFKFLSLLRG